MICPICNQETGISGAEYCITHQHALENVRLAFEKWTVAFGSLTFHDFLQRVQRVPGIGPKTKEIARFLIENPSRWNS